MNRNNYDMSSTGVNISLSIFRDIGAAQDRFKEAFELLKKVILPDGYYGAAYFYKDFGESEYDEHDQFRGYAVEEDSKQLIKNIFDFIGGDLRQLLRWSEINSKLCVEEILSLFENYVDRYVGCDDAYLIFLSKYYDLDFELYMSRGYSQGDVVTVLIPPHYTKLAHFDRVKEFIDHLLWDCPVEVTIEVDNEFLPVVLDDEYNYIKEEVLQKVKEALKDEPKKLDVVVTFLEQNLPCIVDEYL